MRRRAFGDWSRLADRERGKVLRHGEHYRQGAGPMVRALKGVGPMDQKGKNGPMDQGANCPLRPRITRPEVMELDQMLDHYGGVAVVEKIAEIARDRASDLRRYYGQMGRDCDDEARAAHTMAEGWDHLAEQLDQIGGWA